MCQLLCCLGENSNKAFCKGDLMQDVKGYVYVMCNKAMPEICKVGYTLKDPKLRARELWHTGNPFPYEVVYHAHVDNPRRLEAEVHRHLAHCNVGKEWFKASAQDCVYAIKHNATKIYGEKHEAFISLREVEIKSAQEKKRRLHIECLEEKKRDAERSLNKSMEDFIYDKVTYELKVGSAIYLVVAIITGVATQDFADSLLFFVPGFPVVFLYAKSQARKKAETSDCTKKILNNIKLLKDEIENLHRNLPAQNSTQSEREPQVQSVSKPSYPSLPKGKSLPQKVKKIHEKDASELICLLCYKRFICPNKNDIVATCLQNHQCPTCYRLLSILF